MWTEWAADPANLQAFHDMRHSLNASAALYMPDYAAAQDSASGRPLELFDDAREYG